MENEEKKTKEIENEASVSDPAVETSAQEESPQPASGYDEQSAFIGEEPSETEATNAEEGNAEVSKRSAEPVESEEPVETAEPEETTEHENPEVSEEEQGADHSEKPARKFSAFFNKVGTGVSSRVKKILTSESFLAFKAKFFTSQTYKIAVFFFKLLILALCIVQIAVWCVSIVDPVKNMIQSISKFAEDIAAAEKPMTYELIIQTMGIGMIKEIIAAFAFVIFVIVFIFQLVLEGFSLFESRDLRYGSLSAFFSFYIIALFLRSFLGSGTLFDAIKFDAFFWFIIALIAILMIVRMVNGDFKKRFVPILFAILAGGTVVAMFLTHVGDFLLLDGKGLRDLDLIDFLMNTHAEGAASSEALLWNMIATSDQAAVLLPLTSIVIFLTQIIPFAALSLLQYCFLTLLEKNGKQYYHLKSMKKVGVSILVMAGLNLIGAVWIHSVLEGFTISYFNLILTAVLGILTIIWAILPWKIYNKNYKRYLAKLENINNKR